MRDASGNVSSLTCAFLLAPVPGTTPLLAAEGNGSKETHNITLLADESAKKSASVCGSWSCGLLWSPTQSVIM